MQLVSKLTWGYRWHRIMEAWWLFLIIGVLLAFLVGAPGSRKTQVNAHASFEPVAGGIIAWLVAKGLDYAEQHWGSYGVQVGPICGNCPTGGPEGAVGGGGGGGF